MKQLTVGVVLLVLAVLTVAVFIPTHVQATGPSCWGQASAVFAKMKTLNPPLSDMGEHARSFATPRAGLRNLARELFKAELIPDDSMQSLGVFVVTDLGLSVEACMD